MRRDFTYNGQPWSAEPDPASRFVNRTHGFGVRFTRAGEELFGATRLPLERLTDDDLEHALANALMRQLLEEDEASFS